MVRDFSKYIDIPYKEGGRDFNGVDCYGLLWLVGKDMLGIDLPDFSEFKFDKHEWYMRENNHILNNIGNNLTVVGPPYKVFDGLIFYRWKKRKIADHLGVYIGREKFLEVSDDFPSRITKLTEQLKKKIYIALRWDGTW